MEMLLEVFPHLRTFVVAALAGFACVGLANVADCLDAIHTARGCGVELQSAKLRHAMWKLAKEWALLFCVLLLDILVAILGAGLPYVLLVAAGAMVGVEVLSMVEHARLRRDKITKLPANLRELVDYFGEDEIKELLLNMARKKLNVD